jgi:hypothetical protein
MARSTEITEKILHVFPEEDWLPRETPSLELKSQQGHRIRRKIIIPLAIQSSDDNTIVKFLKTAKVLIKKINIQYIDDRMRDSIARIFITLTEKILTRKISFQRLLLPEPMFTTSGKAFS